MGPSNRNEEPVQFTDYKIPKPGTPEQDASHGQVTSTGTLHIPKLAALSERSLPILSIGRTPPCQTISSSACPLTLGTAQVPKPLPVTESRNSKSKSPSTKSPNGLSRSLPARIRPRCRATLKLSTPRWTAFSTLKRQKEHPRAQLAEQIATGQERITSFLQQTEADLDAPTCGVKQRGPRNLRIHTSTTKTRTRDLLSNQAIISPNVRNIRQVQPSFPLQKRPKGRTHSLKIRSE